MKIDKYKIKVRQFSPELTKPLDREKRSWIMAEVDIDDVHHPTNDDGTYNEVYSCKWVGGFEIKQGDTKLVGKSKRSHSQKLRQALWSINPDDDYYDVMMNKILVNLDEVIEFLQHK